MITPRTINSLILERACTKLKKHSTELIVIFVDFSFHSLDACNSKRGRSVTVNLLCNSIKVLPVLFTACDHSFVDLRLSLQFAPIFIQIIAIVSKYEVLLFPNIIITPCLLHSLEDKQLHAEGSVNQNRTSNIFGRLGYVHRDRHFVISAAPVFS